MSREYRERRPSQTITIDCPYCNHAFRTYDDEDSPRCPTCDQRVRIEDGRAAPVGSCSVHPDAPALGACRRCGNFLCLTCRTRWYERSYCVECVEVLAEEQAAEVVANVRGHRWAAWLSVVFGVLGWLTAGLIMPLMLGASQLGPHPLAADMFTFLAFFVAQFGGLGALGMGQAAAAIRTRGDHMILAGVGMVVSGLLVSFVLGGLLLGCVRLF